jgi:uncharacterized protein YfdQ (DUF2303 family)
MGNDRMTSFPSATPAEAAVVAALVSQAAQARGSLTIYRTKENGTPFTVVVDHSGAQRIESLASHEPLRKKAAAAFVEVSGFVDYVKLYADLHSRVFCDLAKASFLALIDYPDKDSLDGGARRAEHKASLQLRFTEEFEAWRQVAAQPIGQGALAEFLEDHYQDVTEPDGAAILELVKTLEVRNDVAFKSAQRRSDGGYDLTYAETVTARAGTQGTIEVPSKLLLELQVFQGGRVMELPIRIRFKLIDGKVIFSLTFLGLEKLLRDEVLAVREKIATAIERPVWAGSATVG